MTINDKADRLIELLADAATAPYDDSPYMSQVDLMEDLDIRSMHTLSDVVTRAATQRVAVLYPGSAIMRSNSHGYRLADEATKLEYIDERSRLRTVRTKTLRAGYMLNAANNGPLSRMVGQQLIAVVGMVIDPALNNMDTIIGEAV